MAKCRPRAMRAALRVDTASIPPPAIDADERAELERLRREVAELRMDREFLKKAAAFFAAENSKLPKRSS